MVRAVVRPLARVCAYQRADGRRTDDRADPITDRKGGPTITTNDPTAEGRNRSIRTCKTLEIENGQLKTSLDVPLSDAAADVLWRIIDRARKNQQA
jgi:hypothetical protein